MLLYVGDMVDHGRIQGVRTPHSTAPPPSLKNREDVSVHGNISGGGGGTEFRKRGGGSG